MNLDIPFIRKTVAAFNKYRRLLWGQIKDPLHRNSLFLIANTVIASGLGFIFWVIVARFYDEADVGWAAAVLSAISLVVMFSRLGFGISIIRFLPKVDKPVELINSCFTLISLITVAVAAVFISGVGLWSPSLSFIQEETVFIVAFIIFAVFIQLGGLTDHVFIAMRRADFILLKDVCFYLLKIALPPLMLFFSYRAFGIVASWGIAVGFALAVALFFLIPRVQKGYRPVPRINIDKVRSILSYSFGNYFATLFERAPRLVLPIMMVNLPHLGAEQTAYFWVAWRVATLLFGIPTAASKSLFAEGSHFEDQLSVIVRRSYKFVFLLLIPGIILYIALGKWLLLLFGASYSANALSLLWILALSGIFVAMNRLYFSVLRVRKRITELVVLRGFVALSVLIGTYLITSETGVVGIGYVWIGTQGLVSAYVVLRARLLRA